VQILNAERLRELVPGSAAHTRNAYEAGSVVSRDANRVSTRFRIFKFSFDYGTALAAMPIVAGLSILLFVINPFFNPGTVFFVQDRMGRNGRKFRMIKFRSMVKGSDDARAPGAKLEEDRIPPLGAFMRKMRIDELPNFINVLRGEMSVVGPRPDAYNHAKHYIATMEGYNGRHRVKPGITGLAQVELGYAESTDEVKEKAMLDNRYVEKLCGRLDLYVIWRTFFVIGRAMGR